MIKSLLSYRQNPNVTILVVACLLGPFWAAIHVSMGGDDFVVRALYGVVLWMMAADVLATVDHAARLGDDKVRDRIAKGLYNATYFFGAMLLVFYQADYPQISWIGPAIGGIIFGGWMAFAGNKNTTVTLPEARFDLEADQKPWFVRLVQFWPIFALFLIVMHLLEESFLSWFSVVLLPFMNTRYPFAKSRGLDSGVTLRVVAVILFLFAVFVLQR
jgi:hypothetical protein